MKKSEAKQDEKMTRIPTAILAVTILFGIVILLLSVRVRGLQDQIGQIVDLMADQNRIRASLHDNQVMKLAREVGNLNRAVGNFYREAVNESFMQEDINSRIRVFAAAENVKNEVGDAKSLIILKLQGVPVKNSLTVFTGNGGVYAPYTYRFYKNIVYLTSASTPQEILSTSARVFFNVRYLPDTMTRARPVNLDAKEVKFILEKGANEK